MCSLEASESRQPFLAITLTIHRTEFKSPALRTRRFHFDLYIFLKAIHKKFYSFTDSGRGAYVLGLVTH